MSLKLSSIKYSAVLLAGLIAVDLVSAQTVPAPAQAKAPEPEYTVAYNVGAVSDYRFRGISQTSRGMAAQGGLDLTLKNGLYLGVWGSNVKWVRAFNGASKGALELDVYGGYKMELAKETTLDLGVIGYLYPGNNSGAAGTLGAGAFSNANTREIYAGLTKGVYTAKFSRSVGDFLGNINSKGSYYLDLSAAYDIGGGMTLTPHIGRQKIANVTDLTANYTDYAVTLAKDFGGGVTGTVAAMGTTSPKNNGTTTGFYTDNVAADGGKFIANKTIVLGVKYSF